MIGTTKQTVSNLVNGKVKMNWKWATEIAPHLGVEPRTLFSGPPKTRLHMAPAEFRMTEQPDGILVEINKVVPRQVALRIWTLLQGDED